ncbi:type II toxin-antitoxin system VapC family toxin [Microbispora hainanensis]|jgi:predicted nucleic acid-binding protein|uniref:Type II toxin-antitoxin system VapC family toxin n=1 Tax=Microbispora hainanensis TaxID=568844 RepID=A0ABZ1T279_9ACTN|nr:MULTISPECIES: type II toxin-antitoxin system VapC family toxin [Microbispora]NJP28114.1 type II toxin-antitoxin system VapC family toxin [Microbispora sp. CL1-1]TQS09470.1 type II toxin-antitoxin system VapC family toxin [Microbispora sp. SCL1-1]
MPGTLVLDSEGLSRLYRKDRSVLALLAAAEEEGVRVVTTVMTTLEADDERVHPARVRWVLSRIDVLDVTREVGAEAAALLRTHRLRGHRYAIDAVLAASARVAARPVTVLTSDPADLTPLCGDHVEIVKI